MTGFARASGAAGRHLWTWEARSVNGRGLEVRCRLSPGFDHLETAARAAASRRLARGHVALGLDARQQTPGTRLAINRDALRQVLALAKELSGEIAAAPPRLDGLLAIRGVIETVDIVAEPEEIVAERDRAILVTLETALAALAEMRAAEGRQLAAALAAHLDEIDRLTAAARAAAAGQAPAIRARLQAQLDELMGAQPALPAERIAQEVALLAARADVREELDRLGSHIEAGRALIAAPGANGRKLDFLAQEFNREANTLCAKSADIELTRIGLALKAEIDRLREQAANIE
ncbi:MAG: YicC/YloC family endoribonuclease [Pseudomonadota bacterium]